MVFFTDFIPYLLLVTTRRPLSPATASPPQYALSRATAAQPPFSHARISSLTFARGLANLLPFLAQRLAIGIAVSFSLIEEQSPTSVCLAPRHHVQPNRSSR